MENNKVKAVYTIIEDENLKKPIFRRVGTCFLNRDSSFNVVLDALPVSGRLHIRDLDKQKDGRDKEVA